MFKPLTKRRQKRAARMRTYQEKKRQRNAKRAARRAKRLHSLKTAKVLPHKPSISGLDALTGEPVGAFGKVLTEEAKSNVPKGAMAKSQLSEFFEPNVDAPYDYDPLDAQYIASAASISPYIEDVQDFDDIAPTPGTVQGADGRTEADDGGAGADDDDAAPPEPDDEGDVDGGQDDDTEDYGTDDDFDPGDDGEDDPGAP